MKNFLRFTGWALFIFVSVLLVTEYAGIKMYDTCLFSLGGESVGFSSRGTDLSPILMGIIYMLALVRNISSISTKNDYFTTNINNFIISIPIILVQSEFIKTYPPFGHSESFVIHRFLFILFSYLSAIIFIAFIIFYLFKQRTDRKKQNTPSC